MEPTPGTGKQTSETDHMIFFISCMTLICALRRMKKLLELIHSLLSAMEIWLMLGRCPFLCCAIVLLGWIGCELDVKYVKSCFLAGKRKYRCRNSLLLDCD